MTKTKILFFLCLVFFLFQAFSKTVFASGTCSTNCKLTDCSVSCTRSCGIACCKCLVGEDGYCGCGSSEILFCGYDPLGTVCNPCNSYCSGPLEYTSPVSTCSGSSSICPSCSYTSSCESTCGAVPACDEKSNSGNDYCTVGQACQSGTCVSGQKCTSGCECSVTITSTTIPDCSQCPKLNPACEISCNAIGDTNPTIRRGKGLSSREWYTYPVTSENYKVWITVNMTQNLDMDLYSSYIYGACPFNDCPSQTGNYTSTTFGKGITEMISFTMPEQTYPQYFLVNRRNGIYSDTEYYEINVTCQPDPNSVFDIQSPLIHYGPIVQNTNDTYYRLVITQRKSAIITLTPYSGNDYNLYASERPGLFPFPEPRDTKNYVCYGDLAGYGGQETCNLGVLDPGTYYFLVHRVGGGYGYTVRWDETGTTTTQFWVISGGGSRRPVMISLNFTSVVIILSALIIIIAIFYGVSKFFVKKR